MDKELSIEAKRFKKVREQHQETQQSFAKRLGIKGSTADIERGKSKITGSVVAELLKQFKVNPLWLYGKSFQQILDTSSNVAPKIVTVDSNNNDNMVLVNVKAAAGYPHNIVDLEWYKQLPSFDLPLPEFRNATYRGFQVEGDSMLPNLQPKEWVLGKAINAINDIDKQAICVIVMQDSVLVKRIQKPEDESKLMLISINPDYPPIQVSVTDIQEVWQVTSKLTFNVNEKSASQNDTLKQLQESIELLKKDIHNLKS